MKLYMIRHQAIRFSYALLTAVVLAGCASLAPGPSLSDQAAATAYEAGNYDRAAERYAEYLESRPADPNGWYRLGTALAQQDQLRQAQHALERALALDPDFARARYNLGLVHIQLGWQGVVAGRRGLPADFDDAAAKAYLACLLSTARNGRPSKKCSSAP